MAADRREIPGFYYDEEKQRYFRAPPGHLAYMTPDHQPAPTFAAESKTQAGRHDYTSTSTVRRWDACAAGRGHVPKSVFAMQSRISTSFDPSLLYQTLPLTFACSSCPMELTPMDRRVLDIKLNGDGNLAVITLKEDDMNQTIQLCQFLFSPPSQRKMLLLPHLGRYISNEYGSCVGVCSYGTDSEIVLVLDGYYNYGRIVAYTFGKRQDAFEGESLWFVKDTTHRFPLFVPKSEFLCCVPRYTGGVLCAAPGNYRDKQHSGKVSVLGLSSSRRQLKILDVYNVGDESTLMSLTFREDPLHLYAGTRSGIVASFDLRTKRKCSTMTVNKESKTAPSVIRLHALGREYLITSCMDSKLLLWDCRMNRQVLSYAEHCNSHYWCQSVVDKSQGFVACVGEDKSIRVWSAWTGSLLRCIPMSEYATDRNVLDGEFPAIAHTHSLGGIEGAHALLVGTKEGVTPFTVF